MPELVKSIITKDFGIIDDDAQIVEGYVTDDLVDVDGHVIDADGFRSALVDYLQWGNIRDQHGLPVGKVLEVPEWNKFVVKIVDDNVWKKVKAGLYKGFSVGIRVMGYEVEDVSKYSTDSYRGLPQVIVDAIKAGGLIFRITKMVLAEVSIVDRPANPRALITATKNMKTNEDNEQFPVLGFIREAQKQYEGDLEMAKKSQTATFVVAEEVEKTVDGAVQDTVNTEIAEATEAPVQENDFETKFASLEGTVNELKANQDSLTKQLTEISEVLRTVSKALEAQAEAVEAVEAESQTVDEVAVEETVENTISLSFDMDEFVNKLDEKITKAIEAAFEKSAKASEARERSGAINLGEGNEAKKEVVTETPAPKNVRKATYGDAAKMLADILSRNAVAN